MGYQQKISIVFFGGEFLIFIVFFLLSSFNEINFFIGSKWEIRKVYIGIDKKNVRVPFQEYKIILVEPKSVHQSVCSSVCLSGSIAPWVYNTLGSKVLEAYDYFVLDDTDNVLIRALLLLLVLLLLIFYKTLVSSISPFPFVNIEFFNFMTTGPLCDKNSNRFLLMFNEF